MRLRSPADFAFGSTTPTALYTAARRKRRKTRVFWFAPQSMDDMPIVNDMTALAIGGQVSLAAAL